jgi:Domain of unknown function (DUF4157)
MKFTQRSDLPSWQTAFLQRSATNSSPINDVPPVVYDVLNSHGRPLETGTREFMESRFGEDFSGVRVHTDSRAAESARAVNALAYTVGENVVFDSGHFDSTSETGKRLLAHELTHVVQQKGRSFQSPLRINGEENQIEAEADDVAKSIFDSHPSIAQNAFGLFRQRRPGSSRRPRESAHTERPQTDLCRDNRGYLNQINPPNRRVEVERSISDLERTANQPGANPSVNFSEAVRLLREFYDQGRITFWHFVRCPGDQLASAEYRFPNEIRLRFSSATGGIVAGTHPTSAITLLHEATHALHGTRYPGISGRYAAHLLAQRHAVETTEDADTTSAGSSVPQHVSRRDAELLRYLAWTEYWAHMSEFEYENLRRDPNVQGTEPPPLELHLRCMSVPQVMRAIGRVESLTRLPFDPRTWTPSGGRSSTR